MSTVYADRAFVSVNGAKIADLQTANLNLNYNAKAVPTMTQDKFNKGFVEGNVDIDIDMEVAVQQGLATPKLETIPFDTSDISITWKHGADLYTATGVFRKTMKQGASGVGQEGKKSWTFGALKVTDAVGNSVLFNLSLG
jgi:hypothetical protein